MKHLCLTLSAAVVITFVAAPAGAVNLYTPPLPLFDISTSHVVYCNLLNASNATRTGRIRMYDASGTLVSDSATFSLGPFGQTGYTQILGGLTGAVFCKLTVQGTTAETWRGAICEASPTFTDTRACLPAQ